MLRDCRRRDCRFVSLSLSSLSLRFSSKPAAADSPRRVTKTQGATSAAGTLARISRDSMNTTASKKCIPGSHFTVISRGGLALDTIRARTTVVRYPCEGIANGKKNDRSRSLFLALSLSLPLTHVSRLVCTFADPPLHQCSNS